MFPGTRAAAVTQDVRVSSPHTIKPSWDSDHKGGPRPQKASTVRHVLVTVLGPRSDWGPSLTSGHFPGISLWLCAGSCEEVSWKLHAATPFGRDCPRKRSWCPGGNLRCKGRSEPTWDEVPSSRPWSASSSCSSSESRRYQLSLNWKEPWVPITWNLKSPMVQDYKSQ